jgi:hypothetical protein
MWRPGESKAGQGSTSGSMLGGEMDTQPLLRGTALAFILYDVCEEIDLDALNRIAGARRVGAAFKHFAPEYVRFERPPVIVPVDGEDFGGLQLQGQIKYYDYGVVSLVFERPFAGGWDKLMQLASEWMSSGEFELLGMRILRQRLEIARPALIKPYENWLIEDYFVFHLTEVSGEPSARRLIADSGAQIAQTLRGENLGLSESEIAEVLQSSLSYYPNDLTVIGWNAAFIYDTPSGAQTALQILEYANSQLLEFRHYDELLTREMADAYRSLERGGRLVRRWKYGREATRLQTMALEVTELTEHADNAIKFVSDMFAARLYRLAAVKVGVPDYKDLVNEKLRTANDLYRYMVEQFQQARAFVLELMVVIILVIELGFLFRGK